ncbi:mast cell protease 1A [Drosophila takahashii]|uniref:mast cell protease 1A n=1 Tax=Drosophila takahashii TaxID=29030 RepID=UPI001CF80762|nr:mast cell protease 1A [Drosophila takahashii]
MTCRVMKSGFAVFAVIVCLGLQVPGTSSHLLEKECGLSSDGMMPNHLIASRIVNGKPTGRGKYPWMAFLHTPTNFRCAGSLINHWFVLTAAHCFEDGIQYTVRLGEYNRDDKEEGEREYDVDMTLPHILYNKKDLSNDIGLLRLTRRVEYLPHIQPICLFVNSQLKWLVEEATWFTATGWGQTSPKTNPLSSRILQELRINRRNPIDCVMEFAQRLTPNQICVGNDDGNLCRGDSGGPQGRLVEFSGVMRFVQMGIASYTQENCVNVSIITDVVSYAEWIYWSVKFNEPQELDDY